MESKATDSRVTRIPPQSGAAFTLRQGHTLRVIDPFGEQVSDLFAFAAGNTDCWLSSGRSLDYAGHTNLTTSHVLYANDSRRMFTIVGDSVGSHDFLLTPCSQEIFEILYGCTGHHPSCFENLAMNLCRFGIRPAQIHTTFNIFMNVSVDPAGRITVGVPRSRAGDWIDLRAEMDLWCGLTACSAEGSNNGTFKPIDFIIGEAAADLIVDPHHTEQVADARPRLSFEPGYLFGNHGAERSGADVERLSRDVEPCRAVLRRHRSGLYEHGIDVEDKRLSLGLHYRLVVDLPPVLQWVDAMIASLRLVIRSCHGRRVPDITPDVAPEKGNALLEVLHDCGASAAWVMGDDANDAPALREVPPDSASVRIGAHTRSMRSKRSRFGWR